MKSFTVNAQIIRAAQACQGIKDVRYYLNGIAFMADGTIAGTDGSILAACRQQKTAYFQDERGEDRERIVKIDGKIPLSAQTVTFDEESMLCRTDKNKVFPFTFIDGNFPNISRIIPTLPRMAHSNGFAVNAALLERAAKALPKGKPSYVFPGEHRDAVVVESEIDEDLWIRLVVMPMRASDESRFYPLFAEESQQEIAA